MRTIYTILIAVGMCALACGQTADGGWGRPDTVEQIEQKSQNCETYTQWQALDKSTYEAASIAHLEEICAYSLKTCKPNITRYCTLGQGWLKAADKFEAKDIDAALAIDYLFAYSNVLASANQDQWARKVREDGAGVSDFLPLIRMEAGAKIAKHQELITAKIKTLPESDYKKLLIAQYTLADEMKAMAMSLAGYSLVTYGNKRMERVNAYKSNQTKLKFMTPPTATGAVK